MQIHEIYRSQLLGLDRDTSSLILTVVALHVVVMKASLSWSRSCLKNVFYGKGFHLGAVENFQIGSLYAYVGILDEWILLFEM